MQIQSQNQTDPLAMLDTPTTPTTGTTGGTTGSTANGTDSTTDALGDETTFLQLLVAQIQNQDPTQPIDSTTFLTQLAQFSSLEQLIGIHQDLTPATTTPDTTTTPTTGS